MRYIDETKKPYPFCPGCTHGTVISAIQKALEIVGTEPSKTVLVSDIGCVGLADRYFLTHTFHGLHGRSFTYACGIKMANPELNIFVLAGDGGCGIGGNHLINAARRNVGITVICFNNFNFGMTGGEHSVTTPARGITNTTLSGSIERPFDLCSLVAASGGGFVARKTAFESDLADVIARAMRHDGFSFVDVFELCTAYYSPMNKFKKADLEKYLADNNLKTGILVDEERPEYSAQLHGMVKKGAAPRPKGLEPEYKPRFKGETYDILLAGSAGMKIVSSAANLGKAALLSDLFASEVDDYPVTVQTGYSLSTVRLSKGRINYLGAAKPDAIVVVSEDGLKKAAKEIGMLAEEDILVIDKGLPEVKTQAEILKIDLGKNLAKTNRMTAAVACLLKARDIIPPDAFRAALEMITDKKIREENLAAYDIESVA